MANDPIIYPGGNGGGGGGTFTPGNTRYVDAVKGSDSNTGGPTDPFQTIQAALNNIGSATTQDQYNTDATARWLIEVGPGVYTENVSVPTRQFFDIHLNNAYINGNLAQVFNANVIDNARIIQNKLVIRGDDLRATYTGAQLPLSGIAGNVTLSQNGSPSSFMQFYLMETGVAGNIITQEGIIDPHTFSCSVSCVNAMVVGNIQAQSGTSITLYAAHCDESVTKSIGGVSGTVTLYQLNNVIFSGACVASGQSGGHWYNVVFDSAAHDFTGYAGTVLADANSFSSFEANVPMKGTFSFSLIDNATGINYTPTTSGDWPDVPSTVQQALDDLAAGGGGGGSSITLTGSANAITIAGSATTDPVTFVATGSDTNIALQFEGKGYNGGYIFGPADGLSNILAFHGSSLTPLGILIQSQESTGYTGMTICNATDDPSTYSYVECLKARGSLSSPTAVQTGDTVGEYAGIGYTAGGYTVFALMDMTVINDNNSGAFFFTMRDAGDVPSGAPQVIFTPTGIGIGGSAPSDPLDIYGTNSGGTVTARVRNSAGGGACAWEGRNDVGHSADFGIGGSTRGDGLQDAGYIYTDRVFRLNASELKCNVGGIEDTNTILAVTSTGVGIGAANVSPPTEAALDVNSNGTQVFYPPSVTTTQKTAITPSKKGAMVFDSVLNKICVWNGSAWETVTSV